MVADECQVNSKRKHTIHNVRLILETNKGLETFTFFLYLKYDRNQVLKDHH